METVVLSLPRMMGTNIAPCVSGSSAIIFWVLVKTRRNHERILLTACFHAQLHKMLIATFSLVIVLLIGSIVEQSSKIWILDHILEKYTWITEPDHIFTFHP